MIWVNNDTVTHTVTADDGSFNSGALAPGQSFSHGFGTAGDFPYHDGIYGPSSMSGTVHVIVSSASPIPVSGPVPTPSVSPLLIPLPTPTLGLTLVDDFSGT